MNIAKLAIYTSGGGQNSLLYINIAQKQHGGFFNNLNCLRLSALTECSSHYADNIKGGHR